MRPLVFSSKNTESYYRFSALESKHSITTAYKLMCTKPIKSN